MAATARHLGLLDVALPLVRQTVLHLHVVVHQDGLERPKEKLMKTIYLNYFN